MRIVAVADTHLFHDALGVLPEGDVLVHAGDMLRFGDLEELEIFIDWFREQPYPTKIVIAGNHDWCFQRDRPAAEWMLGPSVHYLEDSGLELHGLRWWGSPWQPEYMDWAFNLPRGEALRRKWEQIPDTVDVLITHTPPAGTGDTSSMGGRQGCNELRERVSAVQPLLHLFGHIHEDGGCWQRGATASANVTTWEAERAPTVVDVDPGRGEVTPIQIPPAGT